MRNQIANALPRAHAGAPASLPLDGHKYYDYSQDHGQEILMRTIKASEFKAKCLKVMDEAAQ